MDFTTSRVLVMEWVRGLTITSLSPLRRVELDGEELASQRFEGYLQQVLVDGFFHADPHPGNLSLTADHRVALLDLGMVARVSSGLQEKLVMCRRSLAALTGTSCRCLADGGAGPHGGTGRPARGPMHRA